MNGDSNEELPPIGEATQEPRTIGLSKDDAIPKIYADFHNADRTGRIRLNTNGSREDFARLGIQPYPGQFLRIHDGEELSAEGRVEWDSLEGWVIQIDWSKLT